MRKRTILSYALTAVFCFAFLGACGSKEDSVVEENTYWEQQSFDNFSGSDFVIVGESGQMQLLLSPDTGTIRWKDTATGAYKDTNMSHEEGLERLTAAEQSDVIVRYFSGSKRANKTYNSTSSYDSYSMCVSRNQLSYQKMDNGIRILYTIGDDSATYKNFPPKISNERMQEYVGQYLDESQMETLKSRYTQLSSGEWLRAFGGGEGGAQNQISPVGIREIYNIFYEVGHYTDELLYEELETWEQSSEQYPSNLEILIAVEYYLENNGELVVNIDTSLMKTDADKPINQLMVLPYFLTSDPTQDAEEGYMFIPDGSGALMYLDSMKTREYRYTASYYGGDMLVNAATYNSVDSKLVMPVLGMKSSDSTIFAVIEEGAEVASLNAYVSGTDGSEPFSKMSLAFDIQTQQTVATGSRNNNGEYTMYRASSDAYNGNITIRYFWLGEDADYVDMAHCYSRYLAEEGILSARTPEETAPVFVEFIGTTDKTQYFAGIPYEGSQAMTSFKQAKEILQDMTEAGVKNIKVIYSGMVNGGMNQRSLVSGVKFAPGLGGGSAFKSLKSYADSIGAQIFPNVQLQTVYTKTKVSKEMAAWNIINERAQVYEFDPVKHEALTEADYPLYIISPFYEGTYLSKVKKSYSGRTKLDTIASSDLFTFVSTSYGDAQASPAKGKDLLNKAVAEFADGMDLMLSNPIVDAYAYASYLMDIPVTDSGVRVLDASVPFMGMVLNGYMTYSAESSNKESTDVFVNIMRAIESNAQPKFTMVYESSSLLTGTKQEDYFAVDYSYWKDQIGTYYKQYCEFYDAVRGADIVGHELYQRNDKLRIVIYSNGVKVYFNYSDLEESVDGVAVPAFSYVVR